MSAKLLKSLASGKCHVKNVTSSEITVYFPNDNGGIDHLVIRQGTSIDLLEYSTVKALRKSPNLKMLVNEGSLLVI